MARTATIVRETSESKVELSLNLDGTGKTASTHPCRSTIT